MRALLAAALLSLAVLGYMGAFRGIDIVEESHGPFEFVYRTGAPNGGFAEVGRITTALGDELRDGGVSGARPLDVFPSDAAHGWDIGFAVEPQEIANLPPFREATKRCTIERQRFLATRFPYRNPASFFVGYFKVEPALRRYREECAYPRGWALTLNEGETILYLQAVESNPHCP